MNKLNDKIKNPLIREAILKRDPEFLFLGLFFPTGEDKEALKYDKKRKKNPNHIDYCDYSESYSERKERKNQSYSWRVRNSYHTDYIKGDPSEDESVYYDMDF